MTLHSEIMACFLANRETPLATTLQRKSSCRIIFVKVTKIITKQFVPRNYFVTILTRMVTNQKSFRNPNPYCLGEKHPRTTGNNITKKIFWWNYFCKSYKKYYETICSKELFCNNFSKDGNRSEEFQKPQPHIVSEKSAPLCIVVPSWLLSLEERKNPAVHLQFVLQAHLYRSVPSICMAVRLRKHWGLESPESS